MHSKLLLVAALAAPLAACNEKPTDPRGVDHDEILLTVSASGEAESRPDQGVFTVGLSTIEASSKLATEKNNEKMAKIAAALQALKIDEKDLKTQSVNVSRIDYGSNKGKYQANNMVQVRVRNVDQISAAIAATTDAGANMVSGPNLSNADPEKAALSAYGAAYKAARAKAEAYAEAAGMHIARVLTIQDGGGGGGYPPPPPYPMNDAMRVEAQAVNSASPPIMPGMNRSVASVRVDFALEPND